MPWDFAFDWNETRLRNTAPAVRTLLLLGNIVSGVFTTVLAKTLEVVLAHRLHFGRGRPNAAELRTDAKAGGSMANK